MKYLRQLLAARVHRHYRRPPVVVLDEAAITQQIIDVLILAGYPIHATGRERWHERVSVDYGNGPCLTSPCMAFDHLMRRLERIRLGLPEPVHAPRQPEPAP